MSKSLLNTVRSHFFSHQPGQPFPFAVAADLRGWIDHEFAEYLRTHGYVWHGPGSLIPAHDESVLFTGSTVTTFKPYLRDGQFGGQRYFTVQDCLRTQNVSAYGATAEVPRWSSYFRSVGAICAAADIDHLFATAWSFFNDFMGLAGRVRVRCSRLDADLLASIDAAQAHEAAELDTCELPYYRHRFGMDRVSGRNCNFALADLDGSLGDIGNVIVIEHDGRPFAAEVAFGVETIVARLLALPSAIVALPVARALGASCATGLKMADALTAALAMLRAGVRPIATNRGRVLRRYLQAIDQLATELDASGPALPTQVLRAEVAAFGAATLAAETIGAYVRNYRELKSQGIEGARMNEQITRRMVAFATDFEQEDK